MMTTAADLSTLALAAGEPLLLEVQFRAADDTIPDASSRAFVLSFYQGGRTPLKTIAGDLTGGVGSHVFRFLRDGLFTEQLFASAAGQPVSVELSERLRNGRDVVATGQLTIATSAEGVASLDAALIGRFVSRITVRDPAELGGRPHFTLTKLPYSPGGTLAPAWTVRPSIAHDGTPQVDETYTGNAGTIANGSVEAMQWLLDGVAITGAAGPTYRAVQTDVGKTLRFRVTASGAGGSSSETSDAIIVAAAASPTPAPTIQTPASIASDGTPQVGEQLTGVDPVFRYAGIVRRRWLRGSTALATTNVFTPDATGVLTWTVDGLGDDGSTITSQSTITIGAATPVLGTLALSSNAAQVAVSKSIAITGATTGSAIAGTVPDGMVLDSGARTISGTPTQAGTYDIVLTETLAGATGSPKQTTVRIVVAAAAAQPTVSLSGAVTKPEGNGGTTVYLYTVTRSSTNGAVNVPWAFAAGQTSPDDFTGGAYPAGGTVALADGVASGDFSVAVAGDMTTEPDEVFTVSITPPAGYAGAGSLSATGMILNDDAAPLPTALTTKSVPQTMTYPDTTSNTGYYDTGSIMAEVNFTLTAANASITVHFGIDNGNNNRLYIADAKLNGMTRFVGGSEAGYIGVPGETKSPVLNVPMRAVQTADRFSVYQSGELIYAFPIAAQGTSARLNRDNATTKDVSIGATPITFVTQDYDASGNYIADILYQGDPGSITYTLNGASGVAGVLSNPTAGTAQIRVPLPVGMPDASALTLAFTKDATKARTVAVTRPVAANDPVDPLNLWAYEDSFSGSPTILRSRANWIEPSGLFKVRGGNVYVDRDSTDTTLRIAQFGPEMTDNFEAEVELIANANNTDWHREGILYAASGQYAQPYDDTASAGVHYEPGGSGATKVVQWYSPRRGTAPGAVTKYRVRVNQGKVSLWIDDRQALRRNGGTPINRKEDGFAGTLQDFGTATFAAGRAFVGSRSLSDNIAAAIRARPLRVAIEEIDKFVGRRANNVQEGDVRLKGWFDGGGGQWRYRLVDYYDTSVVKQDWRPATGITTSGNTFAGSVSVPFGGPYQVQIGYVDGNGIHRGDRSKATSCGYVVCNYGQSNSRMRGDRLLRELAEPLSRLAATNVNTDDPFNEYYAMFANGTDEYETGTVSYLGAKIASAALNAPVCILTEGRNASVLSVFVPGAGGYDEYLKPRLEAWSGIVDAFIWDHGENDSSPVVDNTYYTRMFEDELVPGLKTAARNPNILILMTPPGRVAEEDDPRQGWESWRQDANADKFRQQVLGIVSRNPRILLSSSKVGLTYKDGAHYANSDTGMREAVRRDAWTLAKALGANVPDGRGPLPTGAVRSGTSITINVDLNGATGLTGFSGFPDLVAGDYLRDELPNTIKGYQVSADNFASLLPATGIAVVNNKVVITLAAAPSGPVKVRSMYGGSYKDTSLAWGTYADGRRDIPVFPIWTPLVSN